MRRDDVPKSTVPKLVSAEQPTYTSEPEKETPRVLTEERYLLEEEFYKTYDPNVGYNTALVLGIMLLVLLVYVIYRTKIRKPLLAFLKKQIYKMRHHRMESESCGDIEEKEHCEHNDNELQTGGINDSNDDVFFDEADKPTEDPKYRLLPTFSLDHDDKQLPIVVMDMKTATADWVQKQHTFLEPGALILKVKSDTICPQGIDPSKIQTLSVGATSQHCLSNSRTARRYIHNCKYSNALNQSLPSLKTQESMRSVDNDGRTSKKSRLKSVKQHSVSSEPKTPLPNLNLKQPVHLTPIIKIQNYDKSQRNPNDSDGTRRDSASSSSSDDPQILRITAERWNKHNNIQRSSSNSDCRQQKSAYINCKPPLQHQLSLDIPAEKQRLLVPVIDAFTGTTSRSCQNITHMETTL